MIARTRRKSKGTVDALLANLASLRWPSGLTRESYELLCKAGFRGSNLAVAAAVTEIAFDCNPVTLRGLFYRVVSAGVFPSTDREHYSRCGRIVSRLRSLKIIPYDWIVDSLRSTVKPSSWSGLTDFADTVRRAYRKDFWRHLSDYVHIISEKDAIAGVISPVTREYDVALSPVRGYCSDSFAYEIGSQFQRIEKPIHVFYLGDHDPSGIDIERDVRRKLELHANRSFSWSRLGVVPDDFDRFNLIRLEPKKSDKRYRSFVETFGPDCAEVDALDPNELRRRVEDAITQFIPEGQWERLQHIEELERESWDETLRQLTSEVPE